MAAVTWLYGFDKLNNDLWEKYKRRIEIMRKSKEKKTQNLKMIQQPNN